MEATLPSIIQSIPEPFSALAQLLKAEEDDSRNRIRVSKLGWWVDVRRVKGSTVPRVWRAVVAFTLWSSIIAISEFVYGKRLGLSNNVTPLLSVVVGLLLVFRNTTAYARWEDGRKTFSGMVSNVRSISRNVWLNVGASTAGARIASDGTIKSIEDPDMTPEDHQAKVDCLRLLVAFVVSISVISSHFSFGTELEP